MISQIFAVIQLVLRLLKLWDQFLEWSDSKRAAEAEERRQKRDEAIEDSKNAETDDEIFDSQDRIVRNQPKP